jgi:hypothetical protein
MVCREEYLVPAYETGAPRPTEAEENGSGRELYRTTEVLDPDLKPEPSELFRSNLKGVPVSSSRPQQSELNTHRYYSVDGFHLGRSSQELDLLFGAILTPVLEREDGKPWHVAPDLNIAPTDVVNQGGGTCLHGTANTAGCPAISSHTSLT